MISLRNIEKYFEHGPSKTFVLRRINVDIREGEFVSIMGPSGAGMTRPGLGNTISSITLFTR
jgi:putative ABC transport system ATP-binding protein